MRLNKDALRREYQAKRAKIPLERHDALSKQIAQNCLKLPVWGHTYFHLFLPIVSKHEINTSFLASLIREKQKQLVISKSNFKTLSMQHLLWDTTTVLTASKYGIPEPEQGQEIPVKCIDVVFVPLLVCDLNGHRIGYGKGFYDRFLDSCKPKTKKVGLSFFKPIEVLPATDLDIPLDYCVTPTQVFAF